MRLQLVLSALTASTPLAYGLERSRALASAYPACTTVTTKQFTDSLSNASSGCTASSSYVWDGSADPTDAQRAEICKCTVKPFNVPKCHWTKLGQYDVTTTEHFKFVYACSSINGKATPEVTEVGEASPRTPASTNPKCTTAMTKQFTDGLNAASSGCTASSSYAWAGRDDPTNAQRGEICKCTVKPFNVPKCHWTKLGQYNVTTTEHFKFVYDCVGISGKATPEVTEVEPAATPTSPTDSETTEPPGATSTDVPNCTVVQLKAFTAAIDKASDGCLGGTSYNWGGNADPTPTQYAEICKCDTVSSTKVPTCSIQKLQYRLALDVHYNWVMTTQCPTFAPSTASNSPSDGSNSASSSDGKSSSNAGLIAGLVACVILIIALIIGFVTYTRNRKNREDDETYEDQIAMRAAMDYQPMGARQGYEPKQPSQDQAALRSRVDHLTALVQQQTVLIQELSGSLPAVNAGQGNGAPGGAATPVDRANSHIQTV